ncbi:MAG: T9SS type A sorting domain-containing protein [Planctomycetes bacterium]|nr:T9SS type A sorting domain-containing protein [Planctomycetota bacterium]
MRKLIAFLTMLALLGPGSAYAQFFGGSYDGYDHIGYNFDLLETVIMPGGSYDGYGQSGHSAYPLLGADVINIPLIANWNWISSNIDPLNPNIVDIWSQINDLNIVQDLYGFYIPGLIDMLINWNNPTMYMVHVGGAGTLTITGSQINPTMPIALNQGWNWIAYYRGSNMAADEALVSIVGNLRYADGRTGIYIPVGLPGEINTLTLEPGLGYRVYVDAACDLTYPATRSDAPELPVIAETIHFDFHKSDYYYPILFVDNSIEELNLAIGDEVALFAQSDAGEFCIGASVWQGELPFTISGWSDDPMTDEKDGYTAGEAIIVKAWTAADDQESKVTVIFEDDNSIYESALYSIASIDMEALGTGDKTASYNFKLEQNRPNPFNPSTAISYEIPIDGRVTLRIFNMSGQLIRTLFDAEQEAGWSQVTWDARNDNGHEVSSGVYFYSLETSNASARKRMVLLR